MMQSLKISFPTPEHKIPLPTMLTSPYIDNIQQSNYQLFMCVFNFVACVRMCLILLLILRKSLHQRALQNPRDTWREWSNMVDGMVIQKYITHPHCIYITEICVDLDLSKMLCYSRCILFSPQTYVFGMMLVQFL